jgi:predicted nucleic-acid-binding protein
MELHQLGSKIKFILVGQGIQSDRLSRFRIFENVNDLRGNDQLYSEVTRTCRLSLQGRKETTLEVLIDSCKEICEHVGPNEVLQMLKGNFLIGQATKSRLPSFYINREVSFKVEKIDTFLDGTFFKKHLAVVKFDTNVINIQNEIRKRNINVVDVHDYLKSTQISNESKIISTNEECSEQLLQDVLEKSDKKSVVYLRISEDNGFLIISIKVNQIHRLTAPVNMLCADPGMGKTTLLKKLRNEYDSRFWTIDVDLKTHNEFFKKKYDANEILNHLFEGNENNFSKHIGDVFRSKKSFVSAEIIIKTYEYSKKELHQYIKKYINNDKFVNFCLRHGCINLLSSLFENSEKSNNYIEKNALVIIQNTIESCYFQENETFRFVIDTLLDKYDFNVDCTIYASGETTLHLAAKCGKIYAVQILIEKGASVYAVTTHNETPLHLASKRGHTKTIALLIEKGASVNAVTTDNETRLHLASQFGNLETVELLIKKGASVTCSKPTPAAWRFKPWYTRWWTKRDMFSPTQILVSAPENKGATTTNKNPYI